MTIRDELQSVMFPLRDQKWLVWMEMVELLISFNLPLTGIIRISQGMSRNVKECQGMSRNEFDNWEERRKYAKIVEHNGTRRNK